MQFSFLLGFCFVGTLVFTSSALLEPLRFKAPAKTPVGGRSSSSDAQPLASHPSSEGCCGAREQAPLLCELLHSRGLEQGDLWENK